MEGCMNLSPQDRDVRVLADMTEVVLRRQGRPDLIEAMHRNGARVATDESGAFLVYVAGELAATITPEMFRAAATIADTRTDARN
jgi:hypothetical protein